MTFPAFILGFLISSVYGAAFHLWRGGNTNRLMLYLFLGWVGFWIGHTLANQFSITIASLGPVRLGYATLGSLVFLGIGYWLSLVEGESEN